MPRVIAQQQHQRYAVSPGATVTERNFVVHFLVGPLAIYPFRRNSDDDYLFCPGAMARALTLFPREFSPEKVKQLFRDKRNTDTKRMAIILFTTITPCITSIDKDRPRGKDYSSLFANATSPCSGYAPGGNDRRGTEGSRGGGRNGGSSSLSGGGRAYLPSLSTALAGHGAESPGKHV